MSIQTAVLLGAVIDFNSDREHPLVPMQQTLKRGLRIVAASEEASPIRRHSLLCQAVLREGDLNYSLLGYATTDAAIISFSAFDKARGLSETAPAHITLNSVGLLAMADLNHRDERNFQAVFCRFVAAGRARLNPQHLEIAHDPDRVEFGPIVNSFLEEKIASTSTGRGCPARGHMLNSFYRSYVEVVFAAPLAAETAINKQQIELGQNS